MILVVKHWLKYLKGTNRKAEVLRRQNSSKSFKDFYADEAERKLRKGKPHRSLGGNLLQGEFGNSGEEFVRELVDLGLKPNNVCVDYGCGTLQIGVHAIRYLWPDAYWGMDVSNFFLQKGRELIGDRLWTEKRPRLRLISPDSVAEVAANKPVILFSNRVLLHVHPDELPEYVRNIVKIIGPSGQAIIDGKWSDQETFQQNWDIWAHNIWIIRSLVEAEGGITEIVSEREFWFKRPRRMAKAGMIRIIAQPPRHAL